MNDLHDLHLATETHGPPGLFDRRAWVAVLIALGIAGGVALMVLTDWDAPVPEMIIRAEPP